MKLHIEMIRRGPDTTVLVTLGDGEFPELGTALHDDRGRVWRVVQHLESEVAIQPGLPSQDLPRSLESLTRLRGVRAA